MAQLMKKTIVFGAGVVGLTALTQQASADTETKPLTLEEVRVENAKRIASYETEKREIDERNRVKRAQYRDAYARYAEFAERGGVEPQEPEYEALPTLELLEEPIELPFDVKDVTPIETVFGDNISKNVTSDVVSETNETGVKDGNTPEVKKTGTKEEKTEAVTSEVKETGAKEEKTDVVTPDTKETGTKEETMTPKVKETGVKEEKTEVVTPEVKETGKKEEATTSEAKETIEKTSSDAVAAQLGGEKTSSDAVAAQLKQTSEETTTTSSADAAAQVGKIESEKSTEPTTQPSTPTETTSSSDAAAQIAKLEAEKPAKIETTETTTTQSNDVETTTNTPTATNESEKPNENGSIQARGAVTTVEKTDSDKKTSDSLPHTGDTGGLMSLVGVALSGLGGIGIRRKRK